MNQGQNTSGSAEERATCAYCLNQFTPSVLEQHMAGCAAKFNFLIQRKENPGIQFPVFFPVQSGGVPNPQTTPTNNPTDMKNVPMTWVAPPGYKLYNQVGVDPYRTYVYHPIEMSYQNIYVTPYPFSQGNQNTFIPSKTSATPHALPNPMSFYPVYPTKNSSTTPLASAPTTSASASGITPKKLPTQNNTRVNIQSPEAKAFPNSIFEEESFKAQKTWEAMPKLPEAPVFRPTEEEFQDPMKYIMSIRDKAKKYGICKIIPPSNKFLQGKPFWKNVNGEKMVFETKLQNIHQLMNRMGPNAKFMEKLNAFNEKHGISMKSHPLVEGFPLDLYKLYVECQRRGGSAHVHKIKRWKDVAIALKYNPSPQLLNTLKNHATKYLATYEAAERTSHIKSPPVPPVIPKEKDDENDFGYLDGNVFSLNSFRDMAMRFKKRWLPNENSTVSEVENLYWKIVETGEDAVQVHYGSDLDVGIYGSGFPRDSETLRNPHTSGWNLNVFPRLRDSLLFYLDESIKGVSLPMLYVGMLFSTFCWHTEDNYLYSINYIHQGAPKSWYGVPAEDAELFESVMKKMMPDLFSAHKDLLYQLVTLMSPRVMVEHNVHIYHAVQNEGEFMITFPKGYHAGFNHGFNTAESCNFAFEDWFPYGRECLKRYREVGRSSVISIEKLVISACKKNPPPYLKEKLRCELAEIRKDEYNLREKVISEGVFRGTRFDHFDGRDAPLKECPICKYDCFLSAVVCSCNLNRILCLNHATSGCPCPMDKKTLLFRYTVAELDTMLKDLGVETPAEIDNVRESYIDSYASDHHRFEKRRIPGRRASVGVGRAIISSFRQQYRVVRPEKKLIGVCKRTYRTLGRKAGFGKLKGVIYTETQNEINSGLYIMESIMEQRSSGKQTEYLIKWATYPDSESTWENAKYLCCGKLIEQFKQRQNELKRKSNRGHAKSSKMERD